MKKCFIRILLTIISISIIIADDGGSRYPEDWTYGNIYVTEENPHIALEKELLIVQQLPLPFDDKFNSGSVEALFLFNNTSNKSIMVPCAFPIVVTLPYTCASGNVNPCIIENDEPNYALWHIALGKKNTPSDKRSQTYLLTEINALDKQLRIMSYTDYTNDLKIYGKSAANHFTDLDCTIIQDDKGITIKTVGIETSISDTNTKTEDGMPILQITMVVHFFHELSFAPNKQSVLSVQYSIDTETSYKRGAGNYLLTYDISTGNTWKDSMDSFIILTDSEMNVNGNIKSIFEETPLENFTISSFGKTRLYAIQNYKPKLKEYFTFTAKNYMSDGTFKNPGEREKDNFVTDIDASSFLPGSYAMSASKDGESVEENTELPRSTYQPETSFDGSLYNGWVEGAKGNGKGEWIGFTLRKSALGPFATNGLTRFTRFDEELLDHRHELNVSYFTSWYDNNRIKSMTLRNLDTDTSTLLRFQDNYPFSFFDDIGGIWFSINAVENPSFLAPGNYRIIIENSYKGDRWDDTVLGEVWFYPIGDTLAAILSDDASSPYPIYHKPLNEYIERYIAQWHKLRKELEREHPND